MIKFLLFLWQLPQNILGLLLLGISDSLKEEYPYQDRTFNFFSYLWKGNISLGNFIFLNMDCRYDLKIIRHEFGHQEQSIILGPLYLLVIGLPSFCWAIIYSLWGKERKWDYFNFYTEKWANKIAGL